MNLWWDWCRSVIPHRKAWMAQARESADEEEARYRSSPFSGRDFNWAVYIQDKLNGRIE